MAARVFLTRLYPTSTGGARLTSDFDIVFVHGVNGGPITAWEYTPGVSGSRGDDKAADSVVWPRDLLPQAFPGARVLTLGYNGDLYRNESVANIRDLAKNLLAYLSIERRGCDPRRPILFIPHCLGGLIVKQALYTAKFDRNYKRIFKETIGVIFLGTPHNGTSQDQWDHIAQAYSALDDDKPNKHLWGRLSRSRSPLMKALKRDSDDLSDLVGKFRHIASNFTITSFYEDTPLPGARALVVDKTGAQMMTTEESSSLLLPDSDHISMCRFRGLDDPRFKLVCEEISKAVGIMPAGVGGGVEQGMILAGKRDWEDLLTTERQLSGKNNGGGGGGMIMAGGRDWEGLITTERQLSGKNNGGEGGRGMIMAGGRDWEDMITPERQLSGKNSGGGVARGVHVEVTRYTFSV